MGREGKFLLQRCPDSDNEVLLGPAVGRDAGGVEFPRRVVEVEGAQFESVAEGYGKEDGLQVVVAVGAATQDLESEIDFGVWVADFHCGKSSEE